MTTTTFTSQETNHFDIRRSHRNSHLFSQNIYQVEVNGEDGEYLTYEIMADTAAEATATAEQLAMESMVDISWINVMVMG